MKGKQIKPFHLYLISGLFSMISFKVKYDYPVLHYILLVAGLIFFIWGIVKYFRE